ncbi:MAG: glutamine-hydrolyzing GMP synthase [Actinobacteria bacterium]|nr:glutamine-hydrolyzing GMP synthase [Actinomycetota bacterium]MSV86517.1 glutamine-hydrolyzing GMP synthase [Actinomycetota bacterium]MSW67718.1 glutamine-hydrolyzing GMP synthase [Actinomycetota bacterium]MSX27943.1 glutamine-hydrolyzing GMP synthase [Actinomycetota bacterium]MSY03207.1 glutamine-hydrolyzing GMP synthase [Actinomycetota bacterium]
MSKSSNASRFLSIVPDKKNGVLVIDFGAQYAQLIARRVREAKVFSEIVPSSITATEIKTKNPEAIILSGGPSSVYAPGAPHMDPEIFSLGIPIFGICYGFQAMAAALGGVVSQTGTSEFGRTQINVNTTSKIFSKLSKNQSVWMSHGDCVTQAPQGFQVSGSSDQTPIVAFENSTGQLAGVQFHPEVLHTENGQEILRHWLIDIAQCSPTWTTSNIAIAEIEKVKKLVGTKRVICGLSGGVDSAVAAAIVQRAIGSQLTCVFIDHGLLRSGEAEQVEKDFVDATGVALTVVNVRDVFLSALAGVTDPETKRKIIGREFIRAFESASRDIAQGGDVEFLVQGTLYPDVVESGGGSGTANIKSHHNVGGLPDDLAFTLIEPLRTLFKDEVRQVGYELGLPQAIVGRQPFPGPGLAIRIIGEVTQERLDILRQADLIARGELSNAGQDGLIWQCPVVLLADVRSVGVQGDGRTYGHPIVLRPVSSEDAMTADWSRLPYELLEKISTRITNEVRNVNRVVLDITSKPPGTIEWE